MNDRELLELAAKAAGLHVLQEQQARRDAIGCGHLGLWVSGTTCWNPLNDDGDALRLAVKLNIGVMSAQYTGRTCAWLYCQGRDGEFFEQHGSDIGAATRRAITRAAAEIGKSLEKQ